MTRNARKREDGGTARGTSIGWRIRKDRTMSNKRGRAILSKGQITEKYEWNGDQVFVTVYLYSTTSRPIPVLFQKDREAARRWWVESVKNGLTVEHLERESS
jgi:hypothetical protein